MDWYKPTTNKHSKLLLVIQNTPINILPRILVDYKILKYSVCQFTQIYLQNTVGPPNCSLICWMRKLYLIFHNSTSTSYSTLLSKKSQKDKVVGISTIKRSKRNNIDERSNQVHSHMTFFVYMHTKGLHLYDKRLNSCLCVWK